MLLIDGTYLVYRSYYRAVNIRQRSGDTMDENHFLKIARNNFIRALGMILKKTPATNLFIAFDPDGDNFRHRLMPSYKSKRKKKPQELREIRKLKTLLYEFLGKHGFAYQIAEDAEGEDIIASMIRRNPHGDMYVYSGDKDIAALVRKNVTFLYQKNEAFQENDHIQYINLKNFHTFSPVPPKMIADYKALKGDKSDSIKGVSWLKRQEAIHILLEFTTVEAYIENGRSHHLFYLFQPIIQRVLINKKVAEIKDDCYIDVEVEQTDIQKIKLPKYLSDKLGWIN